MRKFVALFISFFALWNTSAQIADANQYIDTLKVIVKDGEIEGYIELPEMLINFSKEEIERIRTMRVLERRILRVYPYVVATSENLIKINQELDKLTTNRARNKYIKSQEEVLEKKFKEPLKSLSRKDGQILIKLIHRQTGQTTFHLVKEFKSGWSAFWSNQMAKLFDLNLKQTFQPNDNIEDFYIEYILEELTKQKRIKYVPPVLQYNREKMKANWKKKLGDSGYYPESYED